MKVAVYIGRFQPFHYGHQAIIDTIKSTGYHPLLIIGSTKQPTDRNPIRPDTLLNSFNKTDCFKEILYDTYSNLNWLRDFDVLLHRFRKQYPLAEFHLVIHNKPSEAGKYGLQPDQFISDFILENSSMITGFIDLSNLDTPQINATDIRNIMSNLLKLAPKQSLLNLLNAL